MPHQIDLSIVAPMYNEAENVRTSVQAVHDALASFEGEWEFIVVNDGSVDNTKEVVEKAAEEFPRLRLISYETNAGRGRALRLGMDAARGDVIATIDFDLSYSPDQILTLYAALRDNPETDAVLASAYMHGGATEDVPWSRLLPSRLGNRVLSFALGGRYHTITCIFRAYRRKAIHSLELQSDGKEIHLEILSKLIALGHNVKEVPATLRGRKKGKSKFRLRRTSVSHLYFSFCERPMMIFGWLGVFLMLIGMGIGAYLLVEWWRGLADPSDPFNPERPLMTVLMVLLLGGVQVLMFGFLALQILDLRKQLYVIQRQNRAQTSRRKAEETGH